MFQLSNLFKFLKQHYEYFALGLLIVFVLISNVLWLRSDNYPVENRDSIIYLSRTIQFIESVDSPGFNLMDGLKKMSLGGRPVLLQMMGIPFILAFGYSIDAYTYFNFLFYILLVLATYNIGRNAGTREARLLASVIVALYPVTTRLSKIPLTSFAVIACAALTTWLALDFMKTRSIRDIWLANLSVAFGLLVHPTFLFGVSIPASLLALYTIFFRSKPKWIDRPNERIAWVFGKLRQPVFLYGFLPSALISIGTVLTWYLPFGLPMLQVMSKVSSYVPEGEKFFLGPLYENLPYAFWYIATSGLALSTMLALFFWISLVATNVTRQPQAFALTFFFACVYIAHNVGPSGLGWRYFGQALPIMATLTSLWIFSIRNRLTSAALAIVCVIASVFNFLTISWGIHSAAKPVAVALGLRDFPIDDLCRPSFALYCADPPNPEIWPIRDILNDVLDDQKCKDGNCKLLTIPGTIYFYQAIPFTTAIDFPEAELDTSILLDPGIWGADVDVPLGYYDIPGLLESDYIVYNLSDAVFSSNQIPSLEWFLATSHFFDSPPSLFSASHQIVGRYPLPNGTDALLYKRVQSLTLEEAEEAVSVLDLSDDEKIQKYELFMRLSEKEEDVRKWLDEYKEAISAAQKPEPYRSLLVGLADYYQSSGQTDLAVVAYEQALEIEQNDLAMQLLLSKLYLDRDECKNAIPHLMEIARLQPMALRYVNLGDAYRDCNDLENAIAVYQKALRLDPKEVRAHMGLALSYALQHKFEQARAEFNKVIELAPDSYYASRANRWLEANKNK